MCFVNVNGTETVPMLNRNQIRGPVLFSALELFKLTFRVNRAPIDKAFYLIQYYCAQNHRR